MPFQKGNLYGINRASKYKPAFDERAEETIAKGRSISSLGAEFGVSESTIKGWIRRYKKFAEAVERGEAKRAALVEEMILQHARTGKGIPTALVFLATNWTPLRNQQKHELVGEGGGPIVVQSKVPVPSAKIWKTLAKRAGRVDEEVKQIGAPIIAEHGE